MVRFTLLIKRNGNIKITIGVLDKLKGAFCMFYNNLKNICDKKNIKITPLVLECGGTKGVIGGWKKGAAPNSDIVMKLSVRLNVPTDVLLFGNEKNSSKIELTTDGQELLEYFNKLSDKSKGIILGKAETLAEIETNIINEPAAEKESEEQETVFIEFATLKASAGTGEQLIDDPEQDFIEIVKNDMTLQAKFAIQIHGDSMEPEYANGDIVLVKAQPQIDIGQIGIFTVNDMGYIKKLGTDRLISVNPEYDDIYFEEGQDIRCKGLVIGTLDEDDFV